MSAVMWFRQDLRLGDNPALLAAAAAGDGDVVPLFVLDPALWRPAGPSRRAYLNATLGDLDRRVGGLQIRRGDPVEQVLSVARAARTRTVHIAGSVGPYGKKRDREVADTLARNGVELVVTGTPYAIAPGTVRNRSGDPYQVFTPFARAWRDQGFGEPNGAPEGIRWRRPLASHPLYAVPRDRALRLPEAGEATALRRWRAFLDRVDAYPALRDRPDLDATSRMSVHLKWGEIHPRTLLADLRARRGPGPQAFAEELAWREFYADVLDRRPDTARGYLRPEFAQMSYDEPGDGFAAWCSGRTGVPIVDAGMRQLRGEGWMHNRVRMLAASFLVKDLHVEWHHGARHFLRWLVDGDLASNQHGWQWVAGCGTDAAPYFRIFNPHVQARRFDPQGDYVRRYVPELRGIAGAAVHEPWQLPDGPPRGYPLPIADHAVEREEALRRYRETRS